VLDLLAAVPRLDYVGCVVRVRAAASRVAGHRRRGEAGIPFAAARPALESQLELILAFWDERAIDPHGGYALGHDVHGAPTGDDARHLVTQARVAWFFARLARSSYGERRHLEWAAHGVAFLRERMWDPDHGGFFWEVGPEGVRDDSKHLYGQAFGLFALSEFARAANDDDARRLAVALGERVQAEAHDDRHGGYVESRARDWSQAAPGTLGKMGHPTQSKTINTHLHLLESLTSLGVVHPSGWLLEAIRELILMLSGAALGERSRTFAEPLAHDLTPPSKYRSSYGHDVEGVWLLMRGCRVAGVPDGPLVPLYRSLWETTLDYGMDWERGGLFDSGPAGRPADRREKVWWVQAEALLSALELFRRTGDERYRRAFELTLGWIADAQPDWAGGDWHAVVNSNGMPSGDKSGAWKDPYHQGRAIIECLAALEA
jgi:mannobiose 2-epimerase